MMRTELSHTCGLNRQVGMVQNPTLVSPESPLRIVIAQMALAQTGCILIGNSHNLMGMLTEQDIVRLIAKRELLNLLVAADIMRPSVQTLFEHDLHNIELVLQKFDQQAAPYLPIINLNYQVIGILTLEDFCRQLKCFNQARPTDLSQGTLESPPETSTISNDHFRRMVSNIPGMIFQYRRQVDGSESFPFVGYYCLNILEVEPAQLQEDVSLFWHMAHPDDLPTLQQSLDQSIQTMQPWSAEWRVLMPSGQVKWLQGISKPAQLRNGDVVWDGMLIDITDRKNLEVERDRFFNLPLDILGTLSLTGHFHRVNPAVTAILGYTIDEFLAQPLINLIHPEDREDTLAEINRLAHGLPTVFFENRCRCKDGSYKWLSWKAVPILEESLTYAVARDVTSRKLAEEALRRSHNELERQVAERTAALQSAYQELTYLIENSPLAVIEWDSDFRVRGWSQRAETLFGWRVDEVIGKEPDDWNFVYELDQQCVESVKSGLVSGLTAQTTCHNRNYTKSRQVLHCEWYNSALVDEFGNLITVLSLVLDVTQRNQAEELLKQQLAAIEASIDGIAILDANHQYTYINQAYVNLLGYKTSEEIVGKSWHQFYAAQEMQRFEQEILPNFLQQGYWRGEAEGIRKDSSTFPQELALTRLENGQITCICRDITERKQFESELVRSRDELEIRIQERTQELCNANAYLQAEVLRRNKLTEDLAKSEQALRQSEARLQAILDNAQNVIYLKDTQGRHLLVNHRLQTLLDLAPKDIIGKTSYDLFPPEVAEAFWQNDQKVLEAKTSIQFEESIEIEGELHTYLSVKFPLLDAEGIPYAVGGVSTDITLRKRAEARVLRSLEKEKELNELKSRFVSNTSHEFRTPLTTILGSAELLEYSGHQWTEEKKQKHYQRIRSAVGHMTQLLDDVLTLSKAEAGKLPFNPQPIDVVAFCHELVEDLQTNKSQCAIELVCNQASFTAALDDKLLRQILENLLSNAIKYSPENSSVRCDLECSAHLLTLKIQDQGIGIPQLDLQRLFEPFHRATNVGTIIGNGLGLAIVKRAVDLHHGEIEVNSVVGEGTVCTVRIPINSPKL